MSARLTKKQRQALQNVIDGKVPGCSRVIDDRLIGKGFWTWTVARGFEVTEAGRAALATPSTDDRAGSSTGDDRHG